MKTKEQIQEEIDRHKKRLKEIRAIGSWEEITIHKCIIEGLEWVVKEENKWRVKEETSNPTKMKGGKQMTNKKAKQIRRQAILETIASIAVVETYIMLFVIYFFK